MVHLMGQEIRYFHFVIYIQVDFDQHFWRAPLLLFSRQALQGHCTWGRILEDHRLNFASYFSMFQPFTTQGSNDDVPQSITLSKQ
jgi:hypothetical protein